jgi:hypothetical protein
MHYVLLDIYRRIEYRFFYVLNELLDGIDSVQL